jgi:broad specificity phosphatase PhoE
MILYIFRHAETYFSKHDIPYGEMMESAEILPEGIPAVESLAKYLQGVETDANFSSPYIRCRQTIEIIEGVTEKKFLFDEKLKDWDSRKETLGKMISRIKNFYAELARSNYQNIAICTHGYPINALIALAKKGRVKSSDLYHYPQPGVLVIIKNKEVNYVDFN